MRGETGNGELLRRTRHRDCDHYYLGDLGLPVRRTCLPSRSHRQAQTGVMAGQVFFRIGVNSKENCV